MKLHLPKGLLVAVMAVMSLAQPGMAGEITVDALATPGDWTNQDGAAAASVSLAGGSQQYMIYRFDDALRATADTALTFTLTLNLAEATWGGGAYNFLTGVTFGGSSKAFAIGTLHYSSNESFGYAYGGDGSTQAFSMSGNYGANGKNLNTYVLTPNSETGQYDNYVSLADPTPLSQEVTVEGTLSYVEGNGTYSLTLSYGGKDYTPIDMGTNADINRIVFYNDGSSQATITALTLTGYAEAKSELIWAGGTSGTWNSTSQSWNSGSDSGFLAYTPGCIVKFNSTAAVDVAEAVSVSGMTVSGSSTELKLTRSNEGYIAGDVVVKDGAKLIIATKTDSKGLVRGNINVENGTLQFDDKDVTGYNGGADSTQKITIASGSALHLNHDGNETFAGTLVLNGNLTGKSANSQWDFYGTSTKVQVDSGNTGNISAHTRIRGDLTVDVAADAILSLAKVTKANEAGGTGKINKDGAGKLLFGGNTTATIGRLHSTRGSVSVGSDSSNTSTLTVSGIEFGDNSSSGNGDQLYVGQGSLLKITGSTNSDGNMKSASVILGEWNASTTVNLDGSMLAKDACVLPGITGGIININGTGTLAVAGIRKNVGRNDSGKIDITLNDGGRLILGSGGINSDLLTNGITFKNGTVATYAESMIIAKSVTLSGTEGTVIDTDRYAFATDGNSISKSAESEAATITISDTLTGSGKLVVAGKGSLTLMVAGDNTGDVTINSEATLKLQSGGEYTLTHSVTGAGTLQVESGTTLLNNGKEISSALELNGGNATLSGSTTADGDITVKNGSTLSFDRGDVLDYGKTVTWRVETGGTIDYGSYRQAFAGGSTLELAGGRVIGAGDDYGAVDLQGGAKVHAVADSTIEATVRVRRDIDFEVDSEKTLIINGKVKDDIYVSNNHERLGGVVKKGTGTLKLSAANDYSHGTSIEAGVLETANAAALGTGKVSLEGGILKLAAALSVSAMDYVSESSQVQLEAHSLEVTGTLSVGENVGMQITGSGTTTVNTLQLNAGSSISTVGALSMTNLSMGKGSSMAANETINLNNGTLTLGSGIKLTGTLLTAEALAAQDKLALFSGITQLNFMQTDGATRSSSATVAYTEPVDITHVFSVEGVEAGMYELTFSDDGFLWASQMNIPEPATATLSLLALAGLCARRRRKS